MPKSPSLRSFLVCSLFVVTAGAPSLASAVEPAPDSTDVSASARIAELNEAGAKAYNDRNYRVAIEKFVEAYAIDHDPNLLFNIARAYEKLGDVDAAIEKYETFVAAPGADTDGRLKAKASLRELKELKAQGGTAPPSSDAAASEAPPPSEDAAASGGTSRVWPWVTLGAGVVATGVGVTFFVLGAQDHSQVTGARGYGHPDQVHPMTRAEAQSYVDSGDTKKLIGGIGLGVGGALIATSAWLFLSGRQPSDAEHATFTLAPERTGFSAAYAGRF